MKNILKYFTLFLTVLALSACTATQELRDGASFEGKTTFYVEAPYGGGSVLFSFADNGKAYNEMLVETIKEFLTNRGYTYVEKDVAQVVFLPIWVSGTASADLQNSTPNVMATPSHLIKYVTLEVQAFFPGSDEWQWRGLSSLQLTSAGMNEGSIQDSVYWSLGEFPPEKYPSWKILNQNKPEEEASHTQEAQEHPDVIEF